ncbi:MAG: hypothetical protein HC819_10655 [Cyclobacteriaceae bacterium]|nr:hypothetical protein [Cyclobacteriaceae bacterium]
MKHPSTWCLSKDEVMAARNESLNMVDFSEKSEAFLWGLQRLTANKMLEKKAYFKSILKKESEQQNS